MADSAALWDKCMGAFDPGEVLAGERGDALYCKREDSPFDDILAEFSPKDRPARLPGDRPTRRPPIGFFAGHRGSGKSSMLLRLLERFATHYFVVYFDIEHNLDSHRTTQVDLLYLLGSAIFKAAEDEGLDPDRKHLEALVGSVYTITERIAEQDVRSNEAASLIENVVCFGAGVLGGEVAERLAKAANAILQPFTLTSGVSQEVARSRTIEPRVQDIIANVNLIIADIETKAEKKARARKPLLVVVDGLDKLPRFKQAESIFLDSRALSGPVCRILYTVPMSIYTRPLFRQVEEGCHSFLLPNVKLHEKGAEQQRYEPGYRTLREVARKRLAAENLDLDEVFDPKALDEWLIPKSGGVLRDFVGLVHDAARAARIMGMEKIGVAAARRAVRDRVGTLTMRLTTTGTEELRKVRGTKQVSGSEESLELLHGLFIVAYRNDQTWYDAHPLLWEAL